MNVSVVMACYNGERYIKEQLDSIHRQTRRPQEVIIIDDASSDRTVEIVENFMKESTLHILFTRHTANQGYIKTFYEAISLADGDIVFLCDQDDIWCENKIAVMCQYMKRNRNILSLNSSYYLIDSTGKVTGKKYVSGLFQVKKIGLKSIFRYNTSMGCTIAIRKSLREYITRNLTEISKITLPHDWTINIIAAYKGGLYVIRDRLIQYRLHENNTLGLSRAGNLNDRLQSYRNLAKEKEEMLKICSLVNMGINNEIYVRHMLKSYDIRISAMKKKNVLGYIYQMARNGSLKYCKITTVLYDIKIILAGKGNSSNA